jgi:hypothetical protein
VLQIADLWFVPLSLVRRRCFRYPKSSHSFLQLRKLLFRIRQVLIHLRAAVPRLRYQTRGLSPDLFNLCTPLGNGCPQTCDMWFSPRRAILRLRPSKWPLPPLQNPPLHSIVHLTHLDRQLRKLSFQVPQVLFRIPASLYYGCRGISLQYVARFQMPPIILFQHFDPLLQPPNSLPSDCFARSISAPDNT